MIFLSGSIKDNKPLSFQFCYNKRQDEHVISWHQHSGYSHEKIDSGETSVHSYKITPIMMPDSEFDCDALASHFRTISTNLDKALADFVYEKLLSYAGD